MTQDDYNPDRDLRANKAHDTYLWWLNQAGTDESIEHKTWQNFEINEENKGTVGIVKSFNIEDRFGLFLFGQAGSGKSHIMKAIFNHLMGWQLEQFVEHGSGNEFKMYWVNVSEALDKIRGKDESIKEKCKEAGVLFMDDIGVSNKSEWVVDQLYQILEYRCDRHLKTFITSNLAIDELSKHLHERVTSRIKELCVPLALVGRDRRSDKMIENLSALGERAREEKMKNVKLPYKD